MSNKKADLEEVLRDYEVNLNALTDAGYSPLNLAIMEEDIELVKLFLRPPENFKTNSPADPNLIDKKLGWSPIVASIQQGPTGYQEALFELLRAKADPNLVV